ncbi:MAG: hypothetical protein V4792_16375 [Pseudomonadota bacterium]
MSKRLYSIDAPDQARLKIARTEIEALLKKHDLAGVVCLHTPGMSEFFYDLRPSYSCVTLDETAGRVHVKSKLSDYGGDALAQRHDQAASANMAEALADGLDCAARMFDDVRRIVNRATRAEHTAATYTPDPEEARRQ